MRSVSVSERRARLGRRHLLAAGARHPRDVANAVVALHGTDPATVYLSCLARMTHPSLDAVHAALAVERSLVRMLGMRRTVFVVDPDLLPVVDASSTRKVAASERRKLLDAVGAAGLTSDPDAWYEGLAAEVERLLADNGGLTAVEVAERLPGMREKVVLGAGTRWEASVRVNSRVLGLMGAEGRILRGEPIGAWTGTRFRWFLPHQWLHDPPVGMAVGDAQVELVRRWLARFGPGTVEDLKWWTGWTLGDVRRALEALEAVEVDLDGEPGFLLPDDLDEVEPPPPWVALLPTLDPTPMGWKHREWYLDGHGPELFDRAGNVGPTVWADGRIVGGWAHRPDGSIPIELLERVDRATERRIRDRARALEALVGDTIVIPRFRGPLDRRLAAG